MLSRLSAGWQGAIDPPSVAIRVIPRAGQRTGDGETINRMSESDEAAAVAMEAPSEALLATIYTQYSTALHSYAFHLLGNQEDADDVTQEVFIRVHSHLGELRDPARLRSWLYRIATNLCMDHLRRRSRLRRFLGVALSLGPSEDDGEHQPQFDVAQPGSTSLLDGVAERDHIACALRRMPAKYATCLLLHCAQGLSYREIAESLGISPGAAAVRLTRARDLFERYYEQVRGEVTR